MPYSFRARTGRRDEPDEPSAMSDHWQYEIECARSARTRRGVPEVRWAGAPWWMERAGGRPFQYGRAPRRHPSARLPSSRLHPSRSLGRSSPGQFGKPLKIPQVLVYSVWVLATPDLIMRTVRRHREWYMDKDRRILRRS